MQHPDEGTIHAWLDGALSAEEAAHVDAHVKDCPQCQAAVAEARGFIAASSRILTALDNAPRGVIPATSPKKSVQPWVWRIAATVLVVAGGTLLLTRPRSTNVASSASPDSRVQSSQDAATAPAMIQNATALSANTLQQSGQSRSTALKVAIAAAVAHL